MAVGLTPLSALSATDTAFDDDGISVWKTLLAAERIMIEESRASQLKSLLVGVRVVGHFLCEFWKAQGNSLIGGRGPYDTLLKEIQSCGASPSSPASRQELVASYTKISDLGIHYQKHLMRVFRQHGSLPKVSQHPSRPSMDTLMEDIVQQIKNADHSQLSVKRPALARDGFKCVVSGLIDNASYKAFPAAFPENSTTCKTQCSHIFSEAAQDGDNKVSFADDRYHFHCLSSFKTQYAGAAMAILKIGVNTLPNVVTMDSELHNMWDDLEFWFEEVIDQPNTYNVVAALSSFWTMVQRPKQQVTFTVDPKFAAKCKAEGVTPELPSRGLLAIRAAVSRVAHMSGAAEQYEIIMQYRETSTVIAYDGGSAEYLQALVQISAAEV
ncbi:hypothetical protein B0H11DRAFT_1721899 [Mycena galericulata]|nr:hypothetical protein B0H11DRAFT_1721899 [Mycena galericulata]